MCRGGFENLGVFLCSHPDVDGVIDGDGGDLGEFNDSF